MAPAAHAEQVAGVKGKVTAIVNGKIWSGDLRTIPLLAHAVIQLDVGTPVIAFQSVSWAGLSSSGRLRKYALARGRPEPGIRVRSLAVTLLAPAPNDLLDDHAATTTPSAILSPVPRSLTKSSTAGPR